MSIKAVWKWDSVYREVLNTIYCCILVLDDKGEVLFANHSAERMSEQHKISFSEILGKLDEQINYLSGIGRYQIEIRDFRLVCNVYHNEVEDERMGTLIVFHESGGRDCLMPEVNVDESILQELQVCLESSNDGILVSDRQGVIIRVNSASESLMGIKKREILGQNVAELVEKGNTGVSVVQEVLKTGNKSSYYGTFRDKEYLCTGSPVFDRQGILLAVVVNIRDLRELNELKESLERHKRITEEYGRELRDMRMQHHSDNGMVATSPAMQNILHMVQHIADTDSTVMVTGETGAGKEVIVNEIYTTSLRKDKPMVSVNCGAIPPSLVESELFGYADGAFTGARKKGKPGFFEIANGGTLFLDEVGELPVAMQVKLLRVLQEKEILRVGALKPVHVDVRIIAATNRNLLDMVEEGDFREDLYYRLNVISIKIPPLRERQEDIVPLARLFVKRFNEKYNKNKKLSIELGNILHDLPWPGNVRELENLMESMVVLSPEDLLVPEYLPEQYLSQINGNGHNAEDDSDDLIQVRGLMPMKEAVKLMEQKLIEKAGEQYHSMKDIAKALGVDTSTISRKMKH